MFFSHNQIEFRNIFPTNDFDRWFLKDLQRLVPWLKFCVTAENSALNCWDFLGLLPVSGMGMRVHRFFRQLTVTEFGSILG